MKETLLLTNECFFNLHSSIINHFKKSHKIDRVKDSQLYGFGNYNPKLPNLKEDFELITKGYINGKYIYNKSREAASGKPIIKISGEYKYTIFKYIGYNDVNDFLNSGIFSIKEKNLQQSLLDQKNINRDYYYVSYYFGEDKKMNKGTTVFFNNWKTVEMKYVYTEANNEKSEYKFHANIIHSVPFIFIDTKFYFRNKKSEGARLTFFIGKSAPNERQFLKGTYSGFDKYDRAIAGEIILKKFDTLEEVEEELNNKNFNPVISQELNQKRIVLDSNITKDILKLSKNSPYAKLLASVSGVYCMNFKIGKKNDCLNIKILEHHYTIVSLNDSIIIEDDKIKIISSGRILKLEFNIVGIFFLKVASLYINMYDFSRQFKKFTGSFNGVDVNNNIVTGEVILENKIGQQLNQL